jgi:hypothetical protein
VTALLGVSATRAYAKGDPSPHPHETERRFTGQWRLESETLVNSTSIQTHAVALLQRLESKAAAIRTYACDPSLRVGFTFWWEGTETRCGFMISGEVMRRVAALCKELDFRFIGGTSDLEDESG